MVGTVIGPKAPVAGPASPPLKLGAQPRDGEDTVGLEGGRGRRYSRGNGSVLGMCKREHSYTTPFLQFQRDLMLKIF